MKYKIKKLLKYACLNIIEHYCARVNIIKPYYASAESKINFGGKRIFGGKNISDRGGSRGMGRSGCYD